MRNLNTEEVTCVAGGSDWEQGDYHKIFENWCGSNNSAWVPDSPFGIGLAGACYNHDVNIDNGMPPLQAGVVFWNDVYSECMNQTSFPSGLAQIACIVLATTYSVGATAGVMIIP